MVDTNTDNNNTYGNSMSCKCFAENVDHISNSIDRELKRKELPIEKNCQDLEYSRSCKGQKN